MVIRRKPTERCHLMVVSNLKYLGIILDLNLCNKKSARKGSRYYQTIARQPTDLGVSDSAEGWLGLSPSVLLRERSSQPCDRIRCDRSDGRAGRQCYGCQHCSFSQLLLHSTWSHRVPLERKNNIYLWCLKRQSVPMFVFVLLPV